MSDKNKNSAEAVTSESNDKNIINIAKPTSNVTTPTSSVTNIPVSKLKAPTNFNSSTGTISKIGRPCCHAEPKTGPPPRDSTSMSRESDDNLSSINSVHTDLYQETVRRFTRSSLSPEVDRYSPMRYSFRASANKQNFDINRRQSYDLYLEATGRRRSSDHGAILTHDTEQFIIGQRVWVGGIRPGQIAYIGETHFAPGEWAGVVLDEPNGKNDGCVAGKRYFQCEPKRGIFSRLTRLTLSPLPGAQTLASPLQKNSPERSRTVSPTASTRSSFLRIPGKNGLTVGDRIIVSSGFGSRPGILRYLGETQFASGNWCGIELDEATGKNDGSVDGIRYFECKPKYGVFVPIAKVSLSPSSKKTRLSRTGSRESLTSVGTFNSIASTNTSRLRLNSQDLLREKQSHIEQLMIERDLDREDSQNQALQYQKNINELKTRVVHLERQLKEERKRAEDLQFSIDEVTFCGDELNAQTQVYKEKIQDLENKITDLNSGKPSSEELLSITTSAQGLQEQIKEVNNKLTAQAKLHENQLRELNEEQRRLQENIKYLQQQNEDLQKELVLKDESLEKFSLSQCGIENMRKELDLLKEEHEKERIRIREDYNLKLEEKALLNRHLSEEITNLKNIRELQENNRARVEEECRLLHEDCKARNTEIDNLNEKIAKMSSELAMRKADCFTLEELLKAQQSGNAEERSLYEKQLMEVAELRKDIKRLIDKNSKLEIHIQNQNEELKNLNEIKATIETKLSGLEEETVKTVQALEATLNDFQSKNQTLIQANEELNRRLENVAQALEDEKLCKESLSAELKQKDAINFKTTEELTESKFAILQVQSQLDELKITSDQELARKGQEIERLANNVESLEKKKTALEDESSTNIQQLSAKTMSLEKQIKILEDDLKKSAVMIDDQRQRIAQQDEIIKEKSSELQTTVAALETLSKVMDKLKEEHEIAVNRKNDIEKELKKSEEHKAQNELNIGDLTRKLETSTNKCETLLSQNETLQQDLLAARSSCSTMQTEMKKLKDEIISRQDDHSTLENKAVEERMRMQGQIEELQQTLAYKTKRCDELNEIIQKGKEDLAAKTQEVNQLEEKSIKQELTINDHQRQQENLQTKYEALLKQNESLQNDLIVLRTSTTDSNSELMKLSQQIAAQQKAYDQLLDKGNSEHSLLESQLQAGQQRIDTLCNQVEVLTRELKETHEENLKYVDLLKEEQAKCGKQELELSDLTRKLQSSSAKCNNLDAQNSSLQNDLSLLRASSSDSNTEILKFTEKLAAKQKALQQLEDKANKERHSLENRVQELQHTVEVHQAETDSLRSKLIEFENSKLSLSSEYESMKNELLTKAQRDLEDLKAAEASKQKYLSETFETQLKEAQHHNHNLNETLATFQQQMQTLQNELHNAQTEYKAKEGEMQKQLETYHTEKQQLMSHLEKTQTDVKHSVKTLQEEKSHLQENVQKLTYDLQEKATALTQALREIEQNRVIKSTTDTQLEKEIKKLQDNLDQVSGESEQKTNLLEENRKKIDQLISMLEAMRASNANISATNAELSQALELLEQEKCETANIFELFEMEADQNMVKLVEKLASLKQELKDARDQLQLKNTQADKYEKQIAETNERLNKIEQSFSETRSDLLGKTNALEELERVKKELQQRVDELDIKAKQKDELQLQLEEYKNIVDEIDGVSTEKSTQLAQLQTHIQQLRDEKYKIEINEKSLKSENANLQRKLEVMDLEKNREITTLQEHISRLQKIEKLKQSGTIGDAGQSNESNINGDNTAQINFLNSIIIDMQRKNDTLKAKIEALECVTTDFTKPHAFDLIAKRKPAPRVFCDICDEFDKHETEDCPLQASDDRQYSPPPRAEKNNNDPAGRKNRKIPEPRKYCESCEVFGHETGECDDECY
ncbi:cytoplasmic linker protein 190 isoform 2-T7 [Glossina fuscipes fuscipes]